MQTVVKVALGVVLGGVILVLLGALVGGVDIGGNDAEALVEELAESDEPGGLTESERWCDSLDGYTLSQLDAAVGNAETAEMLERVTDAELDLAEDAPAGASCAVQSLDSLVSYWSSAVEDPAFQDADPPEQIERIKSFQREEDLVRAND